MTRILRSWMAGILASGAPLLDVPTVEPISAHHPAS
jgi:hypothetical protein